MTTDELRELALLSHTACTITDELGDLLKQRAESNPSLAILVLDQLQGDLIEAVGDHAERLIMALAHKRFQNDAGRYLLMPCDREERRLVHEALRQMARRTAKHHPKASKHLRWLAERTRDLPGPEDDEPAIYDLPPITCPVCDLTSEGGARALNGGAAPKPGCYLVCPQCASPLVFDDEMIPRPALKADLDQLNDPARELLRWAMRRARERDRTEVEATP